MASTSINRAFSSSSTNTKATWSFWIKRNKIGVEQWVFQSRDANNNNYRTYIRFASNDQIDMRIYNTNATLVGQLQTNRVFRDTNAWYHIVYRLDNSHGNAGDRLRLYINGVEETSFATDTQMAQGQQVRLVSSGHTAWGRNAPNNEVFLDACLSHVHFLEGEDRDASYFGETDTTTGEWKIKTSPTGINYGTNGYFILKDGNSLTDQSPNSNNFSLVGGTLTKTEDNPSNVFATGNIIDEGCDSHPVFSNGNNSYSVGSAVWRFALSTLGMSSGKFYMEQKRGSGGNYFAGVTDQHDNLNRDLTTNKYAGGEPLGVGYYSDNGNKYLNNNSTSFGNSYANGDIVGTAIDVDNGYVYFSKNGVWQNSGDPTSGSSGTGGIALPTSSNATGVWFFCPSLYNGTLDVNYGNGYFGTTAVSSAGTNASGIGIFEYDVPTGYTALSTKGLNE